MFFFLSFGFAFLLHQAEIFDLGQLLANWWPLIIITIGVIQLFNRSISTGLLFSIVGLLFLINQWFDFDLTSYIWPLIFIIIGLVIILTRVKHNIPYDTSNSINTFLLFSGTEIKSRSKNFKGGSITTIFGGAEIDLREAKIADGAIIEITSVFGGVEMTVPPHVELEVTGIPILGGWEDKTIVHREIEPVTKLKIHCVAILGGIEISN